MPSSRANRTRSDRMISARRVKESPPFREFFFATAFWLCCVNFLTFSSFLAAKAVCANRLFLHPFLRPRGEIKLSTIYFIIFKGRLQLFCIFLAKGCAFCRFSSILWCFLVFCWFRRANSALFYAKKSRYVSVTGLWRSVCVTHWTLDWILILINIIIISQTISFNQ